ncbi:MAG: hypothetical protein AB4041_13945 [Microcystaceae cyanobacterium]
MDQLLYPCSSLVCPEQFLELTFVMGNIMGNFERKLQQLLQSLIAKYDQ